MAPLRQASQEFERSYLLRVLAESDGHRMKAAQTLGISRKNLWEKLRAHGIGASGDHVAAA
jgi:DNA-binding NtrC family response regulator